MIFPFFLFSFSALSVPCSQEDACPAQLQENFIQGSLKTVEKMKQDKEFQSFLSESLRQRDAVLEDKGLTSEFQSFVTNLEAQASLQTMSHHQPGESSGKAPKSLPPTRSEGRLYIFVSFSMGEKALLNLAQEAKLYGTTLILRGFKGNSYIKTVQALQNIILKTGQGFAIDPELFSLFSVTVVPTYVLSQPFPLNVSERTFTPLHDRLQGHVSVSYALETFAKSGDLQEESSSLLTRISLERGRSK